ncbi:antifreeze protein [Marivita sp.]|uniref:antifreeze protein n=1 Tax=Marivita sp. TaxID=2003365 RepID=UPI0025C1E9AD|nr:antifreeze protein [Marivita sp.]
MPRIVTPMDYWANAMQLGFVLAEAQGVIAMRFMGAAGVWSVPKTENSRMLNEKVFAFVKGTSDASLAAISGKSPDVVAAMAIKPIRQATRANHRRLTKRGLKRV